ncbi:hypothetical protein GbCGDNIH6_8181 [Granulibacter bethesdensis]|nr:hypothetical protein GbCGDNIH6_8181 [Granulibacter bethesdensis]
MNIHPAILLGWLLKTSFYFIVSLHITKKGKSQFGFSLFKVWAVKNRFSWRRHDGWGL